MESDETKHQTLEVLYKVVEYSQTLLVPIQLAKERERECNSVCCKDNDVTVSYLEFLQSRRLPILVVVNEM